MIVTLSGPSGVGKTSVFKELIKEWKGMVTATTRPPRSEESPGVDHYFLTETEFDELSRSGGLIEETEIFGHRYGIPRDELEKSKDGIAVCIVTRTGKERLEQLDPLVYSVFIMPPDVEDLINRFKDRNNPLARVEDARAEIERADEYSTQVTNYTLEACVRKIKHRVLTWKEILDL